MKRKIDYEQLGLMSSSQIAPFINEKKLKFAQEYLKDGNATQAAIRAGYKAGKNDASAAVQGSRLVKDPLIVAYRRAVIRENLDQKDLTKENIALKATEIFERCMQKEPVMEYNRDSQEWEETGIWQFDAKGATKALEFTSKLLGLDAPMKHDITVSGLDDALSQLEEEIAGEV